MLRDRSQSDLDIYQAWVIRVYLALFVLVTLALLVFVWYGKGTSEVQWFLAGSDALLAGIVWTHYRQRNLKESLERKRILLVEDDILWHEAVNMAIQKRDLPYNIIVASASSKAKAMLSKSDGYIDFDAPDLVVIDLKLPDGSGAELIKDIKTNYASSEIPIIILTATARADVIWDSAFDLCYAYVEKQGDVIEVLLRTIQDALNHKPPLCETRLHDLEQENESLKKQLADHKSVVNQLVNASRAGRLDAVKGKIIARAVSLVADSQAQQKSK
jgi:two-component system alkaline phosphatase synthesis response regulator PhoP